MKRVAIGILAGATLALLAGCAVPPWYVGPIRDQRCATAEVAYLPANNAHCHVQTIELLKKRYPGYKALDGVQ